MGRMHWRWLMWVVGGVALLLPSVAGAAVLSREVPVGEAYGVPTFMALYPDAASGRDQGLAIYNDQGLQAARFGLDGVVLDVPGLVLAEGSLDTYYAQVASDGTNYFVAWNGSVRGIAGFWGQIVYHDGTLGEPFAIQADPPWPFAIGHNGKNYVIACSSWDEDSAGFVIRTQTFGKHGRKLGPARVLHESQFVTNIAFTLTREGGLLVWSGADGVEALRLNAAGRAIDRRPLLVFPTISVTALSVASDGEGYFVAINGSDPEFVEFGLWGATVGLDGTVSQLPEVLAPALIMHPNVVARSTGYLVTWVEYDSRQLVGMELGSEGDPDYASQGRLFPEGFDADDCAILPWGSDWLAVFRSRNVIYGNKFTAPGDYEAAYPISLVENSQGYPKVVWDGRQFVTAWLDSPWGPSDSISMLRMGPRGRVLDKRHVAVETPTPTTSFSLHSLGSGNVLVSRGDATGVFVAPYSVRDGYGPEVAFARERSYIYVVGGIDVYLGLSITYDDDSTSTAGELITFSSSGMVTNRRSLSLQGRGEFRSMFPVGNKLAITTVQNKFQNEPTFVFEVSGTDEPSTPRILRDRTASNVDSATDGHVQFLPGLDYYGGALWAGVWSDGQWLAEPVTIGYDAYIYQAAWDGTKFWLLWRSSFAADSPLLAQAFSPNGEVLEQIDLGITGVNELKLASDGEGHIAMAYLRGTEDRQSNRAYARVLTTFN
jgi:hypothetical protein